MKILTGTIVALAVLAAQPAAAGPWRGLGGGRMDVQMQQRPGGYQRQPQRQPQREFQRPERVPDRQPQREFQRPERAPDRQSQRDFQRPERAPDRRPDGRLTDEERRDLHRDLDRASREIYKGRR